MCVRCKQSCYQSIAQPFLYFRYHSITCRIWLNIIQPNEAFMCWDFQQVVPGHYNILVIYLIHYVNIIHFNVNIYHLYTILFI